MKAPKYALPVIVLACVATAVPAQATRPLVRPAPTLKNVTPAIPYTLDEASRKSVSGLDLEEPAVKKAVLAQAREYIDYRRGRMAGGQAQSWRANCAATLDTPKETAFCRYESERTSSGSAKSKGNGRSDRYTLAGHIKGGEYTKVTDAEWPEVVRAISTLGDASSVVPLAEKVASTKDCVPSTVTGALGYKLEELFPAEDKVELTKRLYRKASECGRDIASAQASFRLGLILIWQRQCTEIKDLMARTESVSEASQYHARAKYWRHYCAAQLGDAVAQKEAKDSLLKEHPFSFQNLAVNGDDPHALDQLLHNSDPQVAVRSLIRPDLNGYLRVVEALIKEGSTDLASEVIDKKASTLSGLEPEVRLYAALLMNQLGYTLPKFKVLSPLFQDAPRMASNSTLKMLFPLHYFDVVRSMQGQIDPLLILSLIRQESAFNKNARSIVGARGLMQVMPATARMVASVRAKALLNPEINIGVGTKYLAKRLHQYGGDVELTLAAYNAGFARVDQWVKRYPTDNKMLFLDFIPFRETREYVSSILRNYYFYVRLYGNEAVETAAAEGAKVSVGLPKIQAIMSANAGAVASSK